MDGGRDKSLEELYRDHGRRIWTAVLAYSGDREIANDAVAEAFAQALRRGRAIRKPLPWIWRAAFRIAAGEMARQSRFVIGAMEDQVDEAGIGGSDDPSGQLLDALRRLSPMQRGALVLHYFAGYRVREVARILGSTPPAVRVHLMRGRRRLRDLLGEHGE